MPQMEDEWEILMREANELIYAAHVLLQKAHDKMEQARAIPKVGEARGFDTYEETDRIRREIMDAIRDAPWPGIPTSTLRRHPETGKIVGWPKEAGT